MINIEQLREDLCELIESGCSRLLSNKLVADDETRNVFVSEMIREVNEIITRGDIVIDFGCKIIYINEDTINERLICWLPVVYTEMSFNTFEVCGFKGNKLGSVEFLDDEPVDYDTIDGQILLGVRSEFTFAEPIQSVVITGVIDK